MIVTKFHGNGMKTSKITRAFWNSTEYCSREIFHPQWCWRRHWVATPFFGFWCNCKSASSSAQSATTFGGVCLWLVLLLYNIVSYGTWKWILLQVEKVNSSEFILEVPCFVSKLKNSTQHSCMISKVKTTTWFSHCPVSAQKFHKQDSFLNEKPVFKWQTITYSTIYLILPFLRTSIVALCTCQNINEAPLSLFPIKSRANLSRQLHCSIAGRWTGSYRK